MTIIFLLSQKKTLWLLYLSPSGNKVSDKEYATGMYLSTHRSIMQKISTKQINCSPFLWSGLKPGINFKWIPLENLHRKKKLKTKKRGDYWSEDGGELPPTTTAGVVQKHQWPPFTTRFDLSDIPCGYDHSMFSSSKTTSMMSSLSGTSILTQLHFSNLDMLISVFLFFQMLFF